MEAYLRMPIKPEEVEAVKREEQAEKQAEKIKEGIASEHDLTAILDNALDSLKDDEAVEVHIYQDYILVGKRKKGHRDKFKYKFTNYGFSPSRKDRKTESLGFAIRSIDDGHLPGYVYDAINGDIDALRQTTEYLVKAYNAKIKRMKKKGKTAKEIEEVKLKKKAAKRRLTLPLEQFLELSEPIIVEIPKNHEKFHDKDDDILLFD